MKRIFNLVDVTLLIYLGLLSFHIFATASNFSAWKIHIGINLLIFAGIFLLAKVDRTSKNSAIEFVHLFYPVFLLIWLYPQVCLLRFTVIPQDLDPILIQWDTALFGEQVYRRIAVSLSLFWKEFFHGIYFFYYVSLGLFAMLAYRSQRRLVDTYLFTLILCMCIHQWGVVLFPSAGPIHLRTELIPDGILFIPIMDFIYYNVDKGGGAFPSLHSAAVLVVSIFGARMFPKWKIPIYLFCAGVLFSTFANLYHYPIDTIAGVLTGSLCIVFFPKLYDYIHSDEVK